MTEKANDATINWASLSGAGLGGIGVSDRAHCALALIVGETNLRGAVDAYLTYQGGYWVARSVIDHLRPEAAHDRCVEIWRSDADAERRRGAVELFSSVATVRDLALIDQFLDDPDPLTPTWGVRVLTQLAYGNELGEWNSDRYLHELPRDEDGLSDPIEEQVDFARHYLANLDVEEVMLLAPPAGVCRQLGTQWRNGPCVGPVDWDHVHQTLGIGRFGGTRVARSALEFIIGESRFRDAADCCIDGTPGADIARSVLEDLQPYSAGERCIEIWRADHNLEHRQAAVELLGLVVANGQMPIVGELLNDPDPTLQENAVSILATLVESRLRSDDDPEPLVVLAEQHSNERVRRKAREIRDEWIDWPV